MYLISNKLKHSKVTKTDPDAFKLLQEIVQAHLATPDEYILFSSSLHFKDNEDLMDQFVDKFLHGLAYVGPKGGVRIPTYDPFEVAYTTMQSNEEDGPIHQWIGYWTNCVLVYAEYPDHPERNGLLFYIDKETYDKYIKAEDDNGSGE